MRALASGALRIRARQGCRPALLLARRAGRASALAAALALLSSGGAAPAAAHAIVLGSTPAAGSVVSGPDVALEVRFNCRIDPERSQLSLVSEDGRSRALELSGPGTDGTLAGRASGLAPGPYRLRWQVLAVDGHITRGDIAFRVAGP